MKVPNLIHLPNFQNMHKPFRSFAYIYMFQEKCPESSASQPQTGKQGNLSTPYNSQMKICVGCPQFSSSSMKLRSWEFVKYSQASLQLKKNVAISTVSLELGSPGRFITQSRILLPVRMSQIHHRIPECVTNCHNV